MRVDKRPARLRPGGLLKPGLGDTGGEGGATKTWRYEAGGRRVGRRGNCEGATHDPAAALPPALPSAFDCLHRRLVTGLADTLRARLPAVAHLVRVRVSEVGEVGTGWARRAVGCKSQRERAHRKVQVGG